MKAASLLRRRGRGSQGATEAGMALTVAALVVGALVGTGLAATNVLTSDGLTWLGDDKRGTAVQINPATGQPQTELKVAPPGNPLDIAQRDGLLVVRDATTGAITLIDVGTLVATGQRSALAGDGTQILLDANQLYLVDRVGGTVRRIDPTTAADVGAEWSAGSSLVDAALDGKGTVWALGTDGRLHSLTWSPARMTLTDASATRLVDGTGPQSVLVPHDSGVTVIAPEGSRIERVGTGSDLSLPAPQLTDPLGAPPHAPADLVPVSLPSSATVLIVHEDRLLSVDVGKLGCPQPGSPVVYGGRVYVPCLGSGKVLVLDPSGHRAANDITMSGGDPKLVLDDGRLIIHVAGASSGVVVGTDGSTTVIRTHDETVPAKDPTVRPPVVLPTPTRRDPGRGQTAPPTTGTPKPGSPGTPTPPGAPTTSASSTGSRSASPPGPAPTTTKPAPRTDPPVSVVAQARADGTIGVSWAPQGQADRYSVLRGDTFAEVASVPGGATSAIVTTVAPGDSLSVVVEADYGGVRVRSAPSGVVRAFTGPGAPGGVTVTLVGETPTALTVDARWSAATDNGSAITGYSVTIRNDRGFQQTKPVNGLSSGSVTIGCSGAACNGMQINATVSATNAAGTGPSGSGAYAYTAPAAPVITDFTCEYGGSSSEFCDVTFTSTGSIRWQYNGSPLPAHNDQATAKINCGGPRAGRVTVTISNVSGSDTWTGGAATCTGPIP